MPFSLFTSDKGGYPDKFPKPPTYREMLEDIGSMTPEDPIKAFAATLLRKGNGNESAVNDTDTEPASGLYQHDKTFDWLIDSLAIATVRDTRPKPTFTPKIPGAVISPTLSPKDTIFPASNVPDDSAYAKVKQFSTICTKSQDLLENVESKLRQIEAQCQEIMGHPDK